MDIEQQDEVPVPQQAVSTISTVPVYTYILLGCIGAVFIAQIIFGDALNSFVAGDEYSAYVAGFLKSYFIRRHEYWRILTGATVHGGMAHVLMNGYALLILGRLFEVLSNRAHLAIVFLLSCIGGGLLSLAFIPDGISVG